MSRGTPSVRCFADTPAWWNVFSVICVAGSPMDCAASTPHISPASVDVNSTSGGGVDIGTDTHTHTRQCSRTRSRE